MVKDSYHVFDVEVKVQNEECLGRVQKRLETTKLMQSLISCKTIMQCNDAVDDSF